MKTVIIMLLSFAVLLPGGQYISEKSTSINGSSTVTLFVVTSREDYDVVSINDCGDEYVSSSNSVFEFRKVKDIQGVFPDNEFRHKFRKPSLITYLNFKSKCIPGQRTLSISPSQIAPHISVGDSIVIISGVRDRKPYLIDYRSTSEYNR